MMSTSSLRTHGCIPSGLMDLCMSGLLNCSLTWSSSTKCTSSLLQPFSMLSEIWDSWSLASKDWGKEGIHHVLCNQVPYLIQQWPHIIPSPRFFAYMFTEALLFVFDIPGQIQFLLGYSFPSFIYGCSDNVSAFFLGYPPYFYALYVSTSCFSTARSSLSSTQASWIFVQLFINWEGLELHGDDLWIWTSTFGPLFPPGPQTLSPHQQDWEENQLGPHAFDYCPPELCSHFWYCPGFFHSLAMKVESRDKKSNFRFHHSCGEKLVSCPAIVVSIRCSKLTWSSAY